MSEFRSTIFEILSYSIILSVLITMSYTLMMIYVNSSVTVFEPNRYILINEIAMMIFGMSFVVYKMKKIFA